MTAITNDQYWFRDGWRVFLRACFVLCFGLMTATGMAEEGGGDAAGGEGGGEGGEGKAAGLYFEITPSLVTNYGVAREGKLKYVRADVTVKVSDGTASKSMEYHAPYVRNLLLMLLSKQEEADLVSPAGRNKIRKEALTGIRSFLQKETGKPGIEDLFFTNFLVQR